MTFSLISYAVLGGLTPSLVWLYFLLKEDSRCPEPRWLIALAFVAGAAGVPLALRLEQLARVLLAGPGDLSSITIPMIVAWSVIEETVKYVMAALFILWRSDVDEPPDYVVYMFTVALGFAAAENALFLAAPLAAGQFASGIMTSDTRFIGSTLLHVVASGALGFAFAFSASLSRAARTIAAAAGLILSIALHVGFNALIIEGSGTSTMEAFFLVWTAAIAFFAAFEVLKYLTYRDKPNNTC